MTGSSFVLCSKLKFMNFLSEGLDLFVTVVLGSLEMVEFDFFYLNFGGEKLLLDIIFLSDKSGVLLGMYEWLIEGCVG